MQTLPYVVVANPHIGQVYELYYKAFESLRRIEEIKTLDDNQRLCRTIRETLVEHLTVMPKLAMGILECRNLMRPEDMDRFMNTLLRSRISRRVIAKHHLALSQNFLEGKSVSESAPPLDDKYSSNSIGEVFFKCNAAAVVKRCMSAISNLCAASYGPSVNLPSIQLKGHLSASFPYILPHLEYIIGELLRNSIQATIETNTLNSSPLPIEVTISESPLFISIRVSDRGGGIEPSILPHLWSFSTGPRSNQRLHNLSYVSKMAGTMQELCVSSSDEKSSQLTDENSVHDYMSSFQSEHYQGNLDLGSLRSLSERPSNLRLGMGLPLSRIYAEYWAGSLDVQSIEGYGVDTLLVISKLGNQNEQLTTRASMDAV